MPFTTSGTGNVAVGTQVLKSNTSAFNNTAVGLGVLATIPQGSKIQLLVALL